MAIFDALKNIHKADTGSEDTSNNTSNNTDNTNENQNNNDDLSSFFNDNNDNNEKPNELIEYLEKRWFIPLFILAFIFANTLMKEDNTKPTAKYSEITTSTVETDEMFTVSESYDYISIDGKPYIYAKFISDDKKDTFTCKIPDDGNCEIKTGTRLRYDANVTYAYPYEVYLGKFDNGYNPTKAEVENLVKLESGERIITKVEFVYSDYIDTGVSTLAEAKDTFDIYIDK